MEELYNNICFLLTDYENVTPEDYDKRNWENEFYQMLVRVQNAMDMEVKE